MDISKYYAEICKEPLLTAEEEKELFTQYNQRSTPEKEKARIRDKIIRANLRFAFKQAKYYSANAPGMFDELISAGNEGLLVAFNKYSLAKGVRFLTYAGAWVNQRITDHMGHMRIVALPVYKQQICARIDKAKASHPGATKEELVEILISDGTTSKKNVLELWDYRFLTYYINDVDEHNFLSDPIGDEVDKKMDDQRVRMAVSNLPSPHREIMARLYGLIDGEEMTITLISRTLRISKEEVVKYRDEAMEILRDKFWETKE